MRTKMLRVPLLVVAVGAAGALAATASGAATKTYNVKLSGSVEVPKGAPAGKGTAKITLNATKVCWTFKVTGVTKPSAAHIHAGGAGVAGPVVIPLGAPYKAAGCTTASKALLAKIEAAPAKYYVNIHNAKYPNGAVRAQL